MKVLTVIGARPQFIKAAVISRAIEAHNQAHCSQEMQELIVHTGQHYDTNMSNIFFTEMSIPKPDYKLDIKAASHGAMTGRMLEEIEKIISREKPDIVLVHGDTNTTLAGALAAAKLHFPIAHVEAGLRSFNMRMPEEINRVLTDRVSRWLFCPTQTAVHNLHREGFASTGTTAETVIANVGDVMYDAAKYYESKAIPTEATAIVAGEAGYYLATVHRAENTDDTLRLADIFRAFDQIAAGLPVVLPLHPRTRKLLKENGITPKHVRIIEPVGYFDMLWLLKNCRCVLTDSGGLQKEAYFFAKPCVTLRDETEWTELVDGGYNILAGADIRKIVTAIDHFAGKQIDNPLSLYGDGDAGGKIVRLLAGYSRLPGQ